MGSINYKTYSLSVTTEAQELELTEGSYARRCEYIQIRNTGSTPVKVVLATPTDRDIDFTSEGKTITLSANARFDDSLTVEKILYKTDSGVSNLEVYVSW